MNVVLRTHEDYNGEIMYTYEIVHEFNQKTEDTEYVLYCYTGPLKYKVKGRYDTFVEAVQGLYNAMKHE